MATSDDNSSEKRLARVLLSLAHFGKEGNPQTVLPKISQETLAEMVGTTRPRVSLFMNRLGNWVSFITTTASRSTARCSMWCCKTSCISAARFPKKVDPKDSG